MDSMLDAGNGNNSVAIHQRRYLGSKTKLLDFLDEIIDSENIEHASIADIFAGTGVVASHFSGRSDVIVNDILDSNYHCYLSFLGKEKIRKKYLEPKILDYNNLNAEKLPDNYFSKRFKNTYFDANNSRLIGYIREDIEKEFNQKLINRRERSYLICSLTYALDRIAHTVGHYDAYRKVEIPHRKLVLKPLNIKKNNKKTKIYKMDANNLVRLISPDLVYIDPPYNSRQYSDSYHLLENVAAWKKEPVFGVARKMDRAHLKSQYSLKSAGDAFSDLIDNIDAKAILVSYNDMGTHGDSRSQSRISDHQILSSLQRRGEVKIFEKKFNQFTTGRSTKSDLKERIFYCRVNGRKQDRMPTTKSHKNTHLPTYVKSPLNYTGGKHKLLPQLTKYWPKKIDTFYDTFCGGANIGINAQADSIVCIDSSREVINLLQYIQQTNFETLHQKLTTLIEGLGLSQSYKYGYEHYQALSSSGLGSYNKDKYLELRRIYNSPAKDDRSPLLLALILYGFNNQIRFNSKGEFNLPVGKRDYNGSSRKNISTFNDLSSRKKIRFEVGDFRDLQNIKIKEDDFVYLDPPYLLGQATYNERQGWTEKDEKDLYMTLDFLNERKIKFALSNVLEHKGKHNKFLSSWAANKNYYINDLDFHYKNSNYQSRAKDNLTKEVLITNYLPG